MAIVDVEHPIEASRAKRLKAATQEAHERLDTRIMAANPFESPARYGLFVKAQHRFHREIDALYSHPVLEAVLPDLAGRRRLDTIERDLADLGISPPNGVGTASVFDTRADVPTAFGWLYVAEGSNLGAAFLLKAARQLGLSEGFGARHLAGHPDGRGLHWRTFVSALDSLELDAAEEDRIVDGARGAFRYVHTVVEEEFS